MTGLQGKNILFAVTGSIAAYKAAGWVSSLVKEEARVTVVMTRSATRFISPLTFSALSGNRVHVDMFDEDPEHVMSHITLAREADLILVAPATAHTIARLAHGLADDLLAASVLAAGKKPVIVCPAMNTQMYAHRTTRDNIGRLQELGYRVMQPESGMLACGEEGAGRLPEWDSVREQLLQSLTPQDLQKHHILITAGPTREPLDLARFLSNRSSGKMGFALARTARRRGAQVTLVSGPVALSDPPDITVLHVNSAEEMYEAVMELQAKASIIVKSAAVADFRPSRFATKKIKKRSASNSLELVLNEDILAALGRIKKPDQLLIGFAAESEQLEEEGKRKLREKNLDLIAVNDISGSNTGFDVATNQVLLIDRNGSTALPLLSKEQTADRIWDYVTAMAQSG